MSFHIISKVNGPYPPGTWFECMDDGCRQVEIETVNNRMKVKKEIGLVIPHDMVMPHVTSVMKRGVKRHGR